MKYIFILFYIININIKGLFAENNYPTILLHGIASSKKELFELEKTLIENGVNVYNIEIGNGFMDSITMSMNKQCDIFAREIDKLNLSNNYINILALSQGGLTARCYVEKYADTIKKVNTLITCGTPHYGFYNPNMTNILSLDYWKNPFEYENYLKQNKYLTFINNDINHKNSELYKSNFASINNFLLIYSSIDNVIHPLESSIFEFYNIADANNKKKLIIQNLKSSSLYLLDLIGLKILDENNKLFFFEFNCAHDEFKKKQCFDYVINSSNNQNLINTILDFII